MKWFSRARRRVLTVWVLATALVAGMLGLPSSAGAFYLDVFDVAPYEEQAGIEEVILRQYQGPPSINVYASIARFDSAEHAAQALDVLDAWFLAGFTTISNTEGFEPLEVGPSLAGARAYFAYLDLGADYEPYGETTLIHAQNDVYVYTVAVHNDYGGGVEGISQDAAVAMLEAVAAAPAGLATPSAGFGEPATSGTWAKLPAQDDAMFLDYGITSSSDTTYIAAPLLSESMAAIYGPGEGIDTVVGRNYALEEEMVGYIEIAAFDDASNAEAAFPNVGLAQLAALGLDDAGLEEATTDVPADAVIAYGAQVDNEGEQVAVTVIIARSGPYIVSVAVVANASEDVPAFAAELTQAVLAAEPGAGEPRYVDWGMSTGGVWDMMPLAGDEILRGMDVTGDLQLHPAEDDGF